MDFALVLVVLVFPPVKASSMSYKPRVGTDIDSQSRTTERSTYILETVICSLITPTAAGNALQKDQEYDVLKKRKNDGKNVTSIGLHLLKSAPISSALVLQLRVFSWTWRHGHN